MLSDEQIDLYLSNNLSLQDKRRVENELAQDKKLSARVEDYRVLTEAVRASAWMRWESALSQTEERLGNTGFFISDEEIEDYLLGKTEPELTRQIEIQRFGNADFAERIEQLMAIRQALQQIGSLQKDQLFDKTEENLQKQGFFEEIHEDIIEQMPQRTSPILKALAATGAVLVLILVLRWLVMTFL